MKKNISIKSLIIASSISCMMIGDLSAQQEPMYTQYMYNTLAYNPAYAGSRDALSIMGLGRFQWVGISGAPMTQNFQIHSPIYKGLAAGISVSNDMIGPTTSTDLNLDLAYHIKISPSSTLGFGMRGTMNFFTNDLVNLEVQDPGDPQFANNYSVMFGNVGAGVYYRHTNFYVGFSVPNIVEHRVNYASQTYQRRHYYVIAGGYFPVSRTIDLKPTGLVKFVEGAPVQLDLSFEMVFGKRFSAGVMGRLFDGMGVLLGYDILPNFRVGYAFDYPFTELSGVGSYGSHEVLLRYDLQWGKSPKVFNPRYF